MHNLKGKIAVVTGGGTGMGRELCLQLVSEGCSVAACDVIMENLEKTKELCEATAPGVAMTLHLCDVSSEAQLLKFRDEVKAAHGDKLNLLFNNAGVAGKASITSEADRDVWERTFNICWYGVYYGVRTFLPMMLVADEARIINTSSINGFWATVDPNLPHSAYASAKFAIKGFSEALIQDLLANAPHIKVSVVMPGQVSTSISANSSEILGCTDEPNMSEEELRGVRERLDRLRQAMHQRGFASREDGPTTAAEAATIILDGVRAGRWRILVGQDAHFIDEAVRANPEHAYDLDFLDGLVGTGPLTLS